MRHERINVAPLATVTPPSVRRRRRAEGRAGRWDARPALTARDAAALRFIGEHYAVTVDVTAVLLTRLAPEPVGLLSRRTVRQRLSRWKQAGWVERRRLLGQTWVLPTRAGLRLAGLEFDCWEPTASRLAHHHAVALVRLHRVILRWARGVNEGRLYGHSLQRGRLAPSSAGASDRTSPGPASSLRHQPQSGCSAAS
jgi:hypothetical protein